MNNAGDLRIGTRGSAMALAQTREVARLLTHAFPGAAPEVVTFTPSGDRDQTSKLDKHGGKGGAFVGELRAAMLAGELHCAMHSLKDMPGDQETPGLVIAAYLKRDAAEDAIVLPIGVDAVEAIDRARLAGMKIGTNAVRRAAYLHKLFPEAEVIHFRGAADTRLKKLDERIPQKLPDGGEAGPADALIMGASGLERIGRAERVSRILSPDLMLPAVGQAIVAVECPAGDWKTRKALAAIDHAETRAVAEAEREMLWILNGHCNAPIAGYAQVSVARLTLRGAVISHDGKTLIEAMREGPLDRPRELGRAVGLDLVEKGAKRLIETARV
ncbi:MAG: hydroxymethylbilane synthase [Parvularculaceae bacterium]|nr:hydroxymethylbilane synthase [Parvularculaceae bacterium]